MKNYLSTENLISSSVEFLNEIILSSGEMEGCPITNILETDEKTLWLSTEELPQEITINLFKSFFKEFPKKLSSIGIYCWHAYPTNPKLIEVKMSKDKGKTFISLGNFDLCLKPGKQLLQLDDDSDYILSQENYNDNLIIKLIIKETFGDKRTYINNIYLYEDISLCEKNFLTSMEPIKEEESNSMIYLRESRERTLPKSNIKTKVNINHFPEKNNNLKELLEIDFDSKSEDVKNKNKKAGNKGLESDLMMSDSELSEKFNNNHFNKDKKENIEDKKEENKIMNKNEEADNNILNNEENINNSKNNERYFMEKIDNDRLNYNQLIQENEEPHEVKEKEKSLNINDFNDDEENENDNEKDINNELNNYELNDNIQNYIDKDINEQLNNSYREEDLNLLIEEFENYKNITQQKIKNYEKKINYLENQFKEMTLLNNNMNNKINTILESQMNQKKENHDYLLDTMRKIINEKVYKVFSNFNKFYNFIPYYPPYPMGNEMNIPYHYNINGTQTFNPYRNNNIVKRYNMKSEKKQLKIKNNTVPARSKSGRRIDYKSNNN